MLDPKLEEKARKKIDEALRRKDFETAAKIAIAVVFLKRDPKQFAEMLVKKVHEFAMQPHRRNPFDPWYIPDSGVINLGSPMRHQGHSDFAAFWRNIEGTRMQFKEEYERSKWE